MSHVWPFVRGVLAIVGALALIVVCVGWLVDRAAARGWNPFR